MVLNVTRALVIILNSNIAIAIIIITITAVIEIAATPAATLGPMGDESV